MSDVDKLKNVLSFLCILFNEEDNIMEAVFSFSPEYILEKYERYIKSDKIEWPWGMHPCIKHGLFVSWLKKHNVEYSDDGAENW